MKKYADIVITDNMDGTVRVNNIHGFRLKETLDSGQCFRYNQRGQIFTVQSTDRVVKIIQKDTDTLLFLASESDVKDFWINYLSISDDYSDVLEMGYGNEFLSDAIRNSYGIKILKQDKWETIVSFIISQRNNIPKIKSTIEGTCRASGEKIGFHKEVYYGFPNSRQLKKAIQSNRGNLSLGYREDYILDAIDCIESGRIKLEDLGGNYERDMFQLQSIKGIGPKVANCIALFALGDTEAFPIDVWIQRAIDNYFGGELDTSQFGEYAGIIQQYIFFYIRSLEKS